MSKMYFSYFDGDFNIFYTRDEAKADLQERLNGHEELCSEVVEEASYGEIFGFAEEKNIVSMKDMDDEDPRKNGDSEFDYVCDLVIVDTEDQ